MTITFHQRSILLFAFCFLLFAFPSAQHYSFRNYTVADGLGSSSVNHIFQDSKGFIWFATQGGGAGKFNGKEFIAYTKRDGLINNDVTYITEDRTGNIWIATAEGVSKFNGTNFTNYKLTGGVVYCIYADSANKLWFATADSGILVLEPSAVNKAAVSPLSYFRRGAEGGVVNMDFPSNETYTITQDKTGNYYFGTGNGICKYNQGKITVVGSPNDNISNKTFFCSLADASGNIWFGSATGDVVVIHPDNRLEIIKPPSEVQNDFIGSIAQDKQGNIWLATGHGLLKYNGKDFQLFCHREGLSVNTVQAILCDYQGNIWAGTLTGGVNLLSSEAFVHYTQQDGLTTRNITAICFDTTTGTTYLGTEEGLFVYSGNKFSRVAIPQVSKANITSISMDGSGQYWLAAQEGIFVLTKTGGTLRLKKIYTEVAGKKITSTQKIIHDSKDNTWIAAYGSGVFQINKPGEKVFDRQTGFTSDNVLTVFEDNQHNILFGTQDAGVIKYDGSSFSSLLRRGAEGEVAVWSIAEDPTGTLFFGTGETGLFIYRNGETKYLTTKDGLSSDYIPVLYYDKNENCLWLAGEKGLDKLVFDAGYNIQNIHTYKEQDGFSSVAINPNAIAADKNGTLWLGTVNGLWQYRSPFDLPHTTPSKIQLTAIRLFYGKEDLKKYYTANNSLELPYNKNHLTFSIRALTVSDVSYTFKLEGQDEDWSALTANNEITYSNITPGRQYTFRAKAITGNGIESEETVSFTFTVNPPWWKTWWFYLLTTVTLVTGLIFFIKTRERVLREQNLKLEATVQQRTQTVEKMLSEKEVLLKEIHHRVKNNLQTISGMLMLQSMELKDEEAKKAITESQSRVHSIALVHQKLYQTDGLEKVELKGFVSDLTTKIKSLYPLQSKNISVLVQMPETYILIDKAIPLGLILNELITNSLKYAFNKSNTGEIRIELKNMETDIRSRKVKLTYCDNGTGFDYEKISEASPTLGIELIQLLSEQIGASLNYSNNNGSEFVFIFGINI